MPVSPTITWNTVNNIFIWDRQDTVKVLPNGSVIDTGAVVVRLFLTISHILMHCWKSRNWDKREKRAICSEIIDKKKKGKEIWPGQRRFRRFVRGLWTTNIDTSTYYIRHTWGPNWRHVWRNYQANPNWQKWKKNTSVSITRYNGHVCQGLILAGAYQLLIHSSKLRRVLVSCL